MKQLPLPALVRQDWPAPRVMYADTPELCEDDAMLDAHWAADHEDEEPEGISE